MKDVKLTPYPHIHSPTEAELLKMLSAEGLAPYRWANGPGDRYPAHTHSYHKVITVVSGSITFVLPQGGKSLSLTVGDRLDLPAGTVHEAVVGPRGVVCLEGHRD